MTTRKHYDVSQGSQEWLNCRKGRLTASKFHEAITATGAQSSSLYGYIGEICAEWLGYPKNQFVTHAMSEGTRLEPQARLAYEFLTGTDVQQAGFVAIDDSRHSAGASVDGLVGSDGMIEIKCPLLHNHYATLLSGEMPAKHWQQTQGGMWVAERGWCDFISFNPQAKQHQRIFIKRIRRDDKYIKNMERIITDATELLIKTLA